MNEPSPSEPASKVPSYDGLGRVVEGTLTWAVLTSDGELKYLSDSADRTLHEFGERTLGKPLEHIQRWGWKLVQIHTQHTITAVLVQRPNP